MFPDRVGDVRRCCTAIVIGLAVWTVGADAMEFVNQRKPSGVAMMVAIAVYLVMKWAEINFGRNRK